MNKKDVDALLRERAACRLDVGGGADPQPGFINIDIRPLPQVDIVWDIEKTPWPLPDECMAQVVSAHVLEHINPHGGVFINVMDEIWRVLKPGHQFAFVVPYAESFLMYQDPTHCNFINEATLDYFDPMRESGLYQFYKPKPWKIVNLYFQRFGLLECLLEKRPLDPSYTRQPKATDIVKEVARVKPTNIRR